MFVFNNERLDSRRETTSTTTASNKDTSLKMKQQMSLETARKLKYMSLLTLTAQNAILGLSMRYSRTRDGDMFYEATAVLMAELVKFFTCLFLVYKDLHYDVNEWKSSLYQTIWVNKFDTLKVLFFKCTLLMQQLKLYLFIYYIL